MGGPGIEASVSARGWEGKGYSGAWKRVEGMKLGIMKDRRTCTSCVYLVAHILEYAIIPLDINHMVIPAWE